MEVRPLTSRTRALTRRWAPRLAVLVALVTVDFALPSGGPPSLIDFACGLIAAIVVAASVIAVLYVRNRRLVVSDQGLEVSDLLGLTRSVPRSELTELVGLRLLLPAMESVLAVPLACFRGSRLQLCLAGPLWSPDELEAAAERLGLRIGNEAHRIHLRWNARRGLSISD